VKCIHCDNDAKYSERSDGLCPKCKHRFAFEPKSGDKLTDGAFHQAIERVSSRGAVKWTKEHLYYEVARRIHKRGRAHLALLALAGLFALIGIAVPQLFVLTVIFGIFGVVSWPRRVIALSPGDFEALCSKWVAAHGEPEGQIARRALPAPKAARALPSDIEAYSFDRAVICDRAETVDVLVANNFHFENNCAVLSIDGHPAPIFETVRAMLRNNPRLLVFALHDATVEGCLLAHRLQSSDEWFRGRARVIDVGLRPSQTKPFEGSFQNSSSLGEPSAVLSAKDNAWLARYSLSLAVIPPEQLIKRLFRAISTAAEAPMLESDAGAVLFLHDGSLSTEATSSDGGGDSFG
jgi:hypothetical protein